MRLMNFGRGSARGEVAEGGRLRRATQIQGGEVGGRKRAQRGWKFTPRVMKSVLRADLRCGRARK